MTTESTDRADAAAEGMRMLQATRHSPVVVSFIEGAAWGQQRERDRMAGLLAAARTAEAELVMVKQFVNEWGTDPEAWLDSAIARLRAALAEGEGRADDH